MGPALARPSLDIGGVRHELSDVPIAWERALGWIPTFTCTIGELVVRGTIFAPYGRDADVSGAVYALSLENPAKADVAVTVTLAGTLGHRQLRVRTPRAFEDAPRVSLGASGAVLLEGSSLPGLASVALLAEADAETSVDGQSVRDRAVGDARGGRTRADRVLSRRRSRARRCRSHGDRASAPRLARAAVVDARRAAEPRAEHADTRRSIG